MSGLIRTEYVKGLSIAAEFTHYACVHTSLTTTLTQTMYYCTEHVTAGAQTVSVTCSGRVCVRILAIYIPKEFASSTHKTVTTIACEISSAARDLCLLNFRNFSQLL